MGEGRFLLQQLIVSSVDNHVLTSLARYDRLDDALRAISLMPLDENHFTYYVLDLENNGKQVLRIPPKVV